MAWQKGRGSGLKAVIFDLDNTLIDFMKIKKASLDAAVTAMINSGLKMGKEDATRVLFELYDRYGLEYRLIFQKFLRRVHRKVDYRILAAGIVAYRNIQITMLEPYDNVVPTLSGLRKKGLKLAILTDAPRLKAWIRLHEIKIADFFEVVVTFDDTGEVKPGIAPFSRVLDELKLSASECIMVGDSVKRDIEGARRAGMKTVFARYGAAKDVERSGADYDIDGIGKLLEIV